MKHFSPTFMRDLVEEHGYSGGCANSGRRIERSRHRQAVCDVVRKIGTLAKVRECIASEIICVDLHEIKIPS